MATTLWQVMSAKVLSRLRDGFARPVDDLAGRHGAGRLGDDPSLADQEESRDARHAERAGGGGRAHAIAGRLIARDAFAGYWNTCSTRPFSPGQAIRIGAGPP